MFNVVLFLKTIFHFQLAESVNVEVMDKKTTITYLPCFKS